MLPKVGMGKAGWVVAAQKLHRSLPNWITRHAARAAGGAIVRLNSDKPFIEVWNAQQYMQKHGVTNRIIQRVLDRTGQSMLHQMDAALGKVFAGYK